MHMTVTLPSSDAVIILGVRHLPDLVALALWPVHAYHMWPNHPSWLAFLLMPLSLGFPSGSCVKSVSSSAGGKLGSPVLVLMVTFYTLHSSKAVPSHANEGSRIITPCQQTILLLLWALLQTECLPTPGRCRSELPMAETLLPLFGADDPCSLFSALLCFIIAVTTPKGWLHWALLYHQGFGWIGEN